MDHGDYDRLALDRTLSPGTRELARYALHRHHLSQPAVIFPSWRTQKLAFTAPPDTAAMAPSIVWHDNRLLASVRCINYAPNEEGGGYHRISDGAPMGSDVRPSSATVLLELDPYALRDGIIPIRAQCEYVGTLYHPRSAPLADARSFGFEDMRLFTWGDLLWGIAAFLEQSVDGLPEQWLMGIRYLDIQDPRPVFPRSLPRRAEKNWMPLIDDVEARFIYLCDPSTVLDHRGNTVHRSIPHLACEHFRGGSQAIRFDDGWLAVVHWLQIYNPENRWVDFEYANRFVWFDEGYHLKRVSPGWRFPVDENVRGIARNFQLVDGLCWHPDGERLLMGYELYEREPRVGELTAADVRSVLHG